MSIHAETPGGAESLQIPGAVARFRGWHEAGPPDAWERARNRRIAEILEIGNPLVE